MLDTKKIAVNQTYKANEGGQVVKILGFTKQKNGVPAPEPTDARYAVCVILGGGLPGGMLNTIFVELMRFNASGRSGFHEFSDCVSPA